MANCERELRTIQRVKVKILDTLALKLPYLVNGDIGRDHTASVAIVLKALKLCLEPLRNACAAGLCESLQLGEARDRQNARHDRHINSCRGAAIAKPQVQA